MKPLTPPPPANPPVTPMLHGIWNMRVLCTLKGESYIILKDRLGRVIQVYN